jgi:hypothetical protein
MTGKRPHCCADTGNKAECHEYRKPGGKRQREGGDNHQRRADQHRWFETEAANRHPGRDIGQHRADAGSGQNDSGHAEGNLETASIERKNRQQQTLGEREEEGRHIDGQCKRTQTCSVCRTITVAHRVGLPTSRHLPPNRGASYHAFIAPVMMSANDWCVATRSNR